MLDSIVEIMPLRIIILYLVAVCTLISCSKELDKDPYPDFSFPLLSNALEVKTYWDLDIYGKDTRYLITETIAPESIFNFYKNEFKPFGFTVNSEAAFPNIDSSEGEYFKDGNWLKPPASYVMGWQNKEETMVIKVSILYQSNGVSKIICFIHPFSNLTELYELEKTLEEKGQINEMYEIVNKYKKENGNFDIEKAKKEEPKSELFLSITKAIEKDAKKLKNNYLRFTSKN